ncbi:MFS transporter [Pseudomonas sp. JDS28PS106]|uniref:MFS transporter n=1 Tax=Pseudomonas sp. JDS28PS106 TaxID=2497235 RepID=UPI002FD3918D
MASPPPPGLLKTALIGLAQIISWGGSFYLLGVLAGPISRDTGWSQPWVLGGVSIGLLIAAAFAPLCGRLIDRRGGRAVLGAHGYLLAAGLLIASVAPSLPVFLLAWIIIGIAMAGGLYDALFSSLGATYGMAARPVIIGITLISGFCTTVIWPLLAFMNLHLGWRGTCALYAVIALVTLHPLYRYALPPSPLATSTARRSTGENAVLSPAIYWSMTAVFAIAAALMTCLSTVLITILQLRGHSLASAIALSALIGPAQVLCRIIDLSLKRQSPLLSALLSSGLTAGGLLLFTFAPDLAAWALVCYGAGNGMRAIVKSTLPLTVVRASEYAVLSGRMSRPALLAQAIAPVGSGYVIAHWGGEAIVYVMLGMALVAFGLSGCLVRMIARRTSSAA